MPKTMWQRRRQMGMDTCGCCGAPTVRKLAVDNFCRGCRRRICDRPGCSAPVGSGPHLPQAHQVVAQGAASR